MSRGVLLGVLTLLILAVLTWGELQVSVATSGSIPILLLFSIAKAALIVYFFMHISRLWKTH
ncbi:MAG: cytochrome C oxidase subunit IV family protein [Acidiferrobacterales bacterium]